MKHVYEGELKRYLGSTQLQIDDHSLTFLLDTELRRVVETTEPGEFVSYGRVRITVEQLEEKT